MTTVVLPSTNEAIAQAAYMLTHGELVAFPTETVYGLGARIFDEVAIGQIFTVKGRPSDNPLIAHISSLAQVDRIATNLPTVFYTLAHAFFPGPLTVIVPRNPLVPAIVSPNSPTIAIRMPNHEIALALIQQVGEPLVAPSANLSGKPSPTTAQDVLEDLQGKIAAIIDGGPSRVGIESTVLDITTAVPTILRPGAITKDALEQFLHTSVTESVDITDDFPKAPGMKYRHYSPNTNITVTESWHEVENIINNNSQKKYLLLSNKTPPQEFPHITHEELSTASLFQNFRIADREHYDGIIIFVDPQSKTNSGLMNRIEKAANRL